MANSEAKYGTKIQYDPLWKGPMQNIRFPTDRIWLIIFLSYIVVYICAASYGLIEGDLNKLSMPTDYAGRTCGIDEEVHDKPYLLIIDLKLRSRFDTLLDSPSVCVSQCPTRNFIYKRDSFETLDKVKDKIFCTTDVNLTSITSFDQLEILISNKKCTRWYLKSEPIYNRCLAFNAWEGHENETISSDDLYKARTEIKNGEFIIETIYNDSSSAVKPSIVAIICGGLIALLYVVLLKWFAVPFFYASIGMFCGFAVYGFYCLCVDYVASKSNQTLLALIILLLLIVVVVITVVYLRKKIYLACQLVKESSKAVIDLSATLLFPILPWLLYVLVIVFSVLVLMSLLTITIPNYKIERIGQGNEDGCECIDVNETALYNGDPCDPIVFNSKCQANGQACQFLQCRLTSTMSPCYVNVLHAINIVGFYWILFFISGFEYMALSGTFATWYWSFNKSSVPNYVLLQSSCRTLRYHLGSIAIGSLILTIAQIIRLIFHGIQSKLQQTHNTFAAGIMCCCGSIFSFLANIVNFLNYNAYIMCAIHGKSFCQSAKNAYYLIMRNVVKVVVVNTVAEWLFVMAKLLVTSIAVAGITVYFNYTYTGDKDSGMFSTGIIITAIGTYIIASVFFSVQSIAVNTIFLCCIEDSERNDGSDERPYYMSKKLKQLLYK